MKLRNRNLSKSNNLLKIQFVHHHLAIKKTFFLLFITKYICILKAITVLVSFVNRTHKTNGKQYHRHVMIAH